MLVLVTKNSYKRGGIMTNRDYGERILLPRGGYKQGTLDQSKISRLFRLL